MQRLFIITEPEQKERSAVFREGFARLSLPCAGALIEGPLTWVRTWKELSKKSGEYDSVLVFSGAHSWVPLITSLATATPVVWAPAFSSYDRRVNDDNGRSVARSSFFLWIREWVLSYAVDHIILPSRALSDFFARTYNLPPQKVSWVTDGIDDKLFTPAPQQPDASTNFELIYIGDFAHGDGIDIVLRAAKILDMESAIRFTIIGGGNGESHARTLAKEISVKNVTFLPYVSREELPQRVRSAHALLGAFGHTPYTARMIPERFYIASASCRPLLTAHIPVLDEVFSVDDTFFVVPENDPAQLADAIRTLRDNSMGITMKTNAAYQRYSAIGTPDIIARRLSDTLEAVRGA